MNILYSASWGGGGVVPESCVARIQHIIEHINIDTPTSEKQQARTILYVDLSFAQNSIHYYESQSDLLQGGIFQLHNKTLTNPEKPD